jgi:hypothetical protein
MAGMLNEILARQRVQELLRKAEEERCVARVEHPGARPLLGALVGRRRRGFAQDGAAAKIVRCAHDA